MHVHAILNIVSSLFVVLWWPGKGVSPHHSMVGWHRSLEHYWHAIEMETEKHVCLYGKSETSSKIQR